MGFDSYKVLNDWLNKLKCLLFRHPHEIWELWLIYWSLITCLHSKTGEFSCACYFLTIYFGGKGPLCIYWTNLCVDLIQSIIQSDSEVCPHCDRFNHWYVACTSLSKKLHHSFELFLCYSHPIFILLTQIGRYIFDNFEEFHLKLIWLSVFLVYTLFFHSIFQNADHKNVTILRNPTSWGM